MSKWHARPHEAAHGCIVIGEPYSWARKIILINPMEKRYFKQSFVLWFGAYGTTYLRVYADSLEDALEWCGEWLKLYEPGVFTDEPTFDEDGNAIDNSDADLTYTESGWIASWEWGISLDNPSVNELYQFMCER